MGLLGHGIVLSDDFEMEPIVIPDDTGQGASLRSFVADKDYADRISTFEIIDNAAPFKMAKRANMAKGATILSTGEGTDPPVSAKALDTTFVRSTTGAVVNALLVLYTMDEEVR